MLRTAIAVFVIAASISLAAQTGAATPDVQSRKQTPAKPAAEGKTAASSKSTAATPPPDRALMQRVWDAWCTLDPANAARFYAKDPSLVFYDMTPLKYSGWSEYAAGSAKLLAGFQSVKVTLGDDAKVYMADSGSIPKTPERDGAGALGTATWHADIVNKDGTKQTLDGRWTVVWEKTGGEWLIVHEHVSLPMK